MSDECVRIEDMELAKFFHDLFLSFMDFTIGIVPTSRMKKITRYMQDTMYHFLDFKLLGLIEHNDPETTLEMYRRCLEGNELAERIGLESREERYGTAWTITVSNCVFGNSCRRLRAERFMCPAALFAGFLLQGSGSGRVRMDTSRLTMLGCETVIEVWDEVLKPERMIIKG